MKIVNGDICSIECDAIVNASNGIGYMGGPIGKVFKRKGVAESIHYFTKGLVEKDAFKLCINKDHPKDFKPGEVFVTNGYNLPCKVILHAVTMHLPGTKSNLKIVEVLTEKILKMSSENGYKTIAIPLLGTGTGGLKKDDVLKIYERVFNNSDTEVFIVVK